MTMPLNTGPPPIEPKGGSKESDNQDLSYIWTLITLVVSLWFGRYSDLRWTPFLVWVPGAFGLFLIRKSRPGSFNEHAVILILAGLGMTAVPILEVSLRARIQAPEPTTSPVVSEISYEELETITLSGFRTDSAGKRRFVLLKIDAIEHRPHRFIFYYSLNEGLVRYRDQGYIYPVSHTLELKDRTIFRYQKENGIIKLRARNRANYELSQTSVK